VTSRRGWTSAVIRVIVGGAVYAAIPVYGVPASVGVLAASCRIRMRGAGRAVDESFRKIMVVVPRWLKRGRTRVTRAVQLDEFGRWARKGPARFLKQTGRIRASVGRSARRNLAGGLTRLARLRGHRGDR